MARPVFGWFDLFRFLAASMVVLEHARDLLWLPASSAGSAGMGIKLVYFLTGFGHEAVIVFFVLSGFWISAAVDRRCDRSDFWSGYLIDRLARLMIVLAPALAIGAALDAIGAFALHGPLYFGTTGAATMNADVTARMTPLVFLGNLGFLQSLAVPPYGSNGPLWSLANEFWYYMWYPALLLLVMRHRATGALATLTVAALWPKLIPGFVVWLLGSLLYRLDRERIGHALPRSARIVMLVATLAVAVGAATASRLSMVPERIADFMVGVAFFGLFWAVLLLEAPLPRWLAPVAHYGTQASFSLYVTHFPFAVLLATLLLHGQRLVSNASSLALLGAMIAVLWAYGWLFAQATEARTAVLRQWLHRRVRATAQAVSSPRSDDGTSG